MSLSSTFYSKFAKFIFVGILNTIFGYSVYAILLYVDTPYLIALLVATLTGTVFNYYSFGRFAFNSIGSSKIFLKFIFAYIIIYSINASLLKLLIDYLIINNYFSQIICLLINILLSWVLMSHWVYKND